ncbi:MAG: Ig-like domain-containing protein [Deltaproteobacteria bacterium]|nr:Ig-like domain-containing protein [Deltaproteobacteria bacterium]
MNRTLALSLLLVAGTFSIAKAENRTGPMVPNASGLIKTFDWVEPELDQLPPGTAAAVDSRIIYINNCKPGGCQLTPGSNGPANQSQIIGNSARNISAYTGSDATFNQIVQCVRDTYAAYNVQIVTERPPTGSRYHTAIMAGSPTQIGKPNGVLGVSPFSCGYIANTISFTFGNVIPTDVAELCWTVAQETAHSWGLDHKLDRLDPMTYIPNRSGDPQFKRFQNTAGNCGEDQIRDCSCDYAGTPNKMNSHALILATFGASAPDVEDPEIAITAPLDGESVEPGFAIRTNPTDDVAISKVEFRVDNALLHTAYAFPYVANASATLAMGAHRVEVTAFDIAGNATKTAINVVYGTPCSNPSDCAVDGDTCVEGRCVPGAGTPGGLGSPCTGNEMCNSLQCASDGTGSYCVEPCSLDAQGCPSGFGCVDTGNGAGVCFPGADGGGGCNTSSSGGAMLLGLSFGAILLTRRRRN